MELVNQIRSNFPKTIDKSKPIFSALIANDNGNAAIQEQIDYLLKYMKEWISTPNVYNQSGLMLEKTIKFFSYLERFADETEASLKNRFKAIFVRNHDTKWGTPYDVKSVFRQYFPHAEIYLVENVNKIDSVIPEEANFIVDGDISTSSPTVWKGSGWTADKDAAFSKSYGIKMNTASGVLYQDIQDLPNRVRINETEPYEYKNLTYYLHFFMQGKIDVQITRVDDGTTKYWDYSDNTWKTTVVNNRFETTEWNDCSLYFFTDGDDDTRDITVKFNYVDTLTYLDYFRLFQKQPYSSFTVIAHFTGNTSLGAFGLAAGDDDPNDGSEAATPPQPRYGNYGYYDKSFLSGVPIGFASDIYEDLLNYLRSQGVMASLDIVIKDFIPSE